MVTPQEIYKKFSLKINKNDTNRNIKVPKSQFVILFNEQKRKFLDDSLKQYENSDYIEDFSDLLEVNIELVKATEDDFKAIFKLPTNFLKRVGSYSLATKGECKDEILTNWYYKPKDINVLLTNENYNPSFEYRETPALINRDTITIYKKDFTLNKLFFTYYREPQDIDIEGYKHLDNTDSVNKSIDLSMINVEKIIDRVVVEATRNYESLEQMQLAFQRQQLNEK